MSNLSGKDILIILKLKYKPVKGNKERVRIFGKNFVKNNRNKLKVKYKGKKYKIKKFINDIDENYNNEDEIELELIGINNTSNYSEMFCECKFIRTVNNKNINISKVKSNKNSSNNNSQIFHTTEEDNKNSPSVNSAEIIFDNQPKQSDREPNLQLLKILESNISNDKSINSILSNNNSSESLFDVRSMLYDCKLIESLSDNSKWNTENVINMYRMFYNPYHHYQIYQI